MEPIKFKINIYSGYKKISNLCFIPSPDLTYLYRGSITS